jgi:hypothetical protein
LEEIVLNVLRDSVQAFIIVVLVGLLLARTALADISAGQPNPDRAAFVACDEAEVHMRESSDKFADASSKCSLAVAHYVKEAMSATDQETGCRASLYAGSSGLLYRYVVSNSAQPGHASKMRAFAEEALKFVIANCPNDPNMIRAAKAQLQFEKRMFGPG